MSNLIIIIIYLLCNYSDEISLASAFSFINDILAVDKSFAYTLPIKVASISLTNLILLNPDADRSSRTFIPLKLS